MIRQPDSSQVEIFHAKMRQPSFVLSERVLLLQDFSFCLFWFSCFVGFCFLFVSVVNMFFSTGGF